MSNLQSQNFLYDLQHLHSSCTLLNQSPKLQPSFKNAPFYFAVSDTYYLDLRVQQEIDSSSFETRIETSIIIQSSTFLPQSPTPKNVTEKTSKKANKAPRKPIQKDSRNVASNLMRIFLKNVMELKFYDEMIGKMIIHHSLNITKQEFHQWLTSFNINFKNYIRYNELRRLCSGTQRRQMHSIARVLFRKFVKGIGISHALTSKRIERSSTAMHLLGLRNLPSELRVI